MAASILGIGVRALNVAQMGLVTTQHNISNVNTPGFHRQQIVQSTLLPFGTGAGWLGQGAGVDTVKRIYSEFLDKQVLSTASQSSYFDAYHFQLKQIDNLLADPSLPALHLEQPPLSALGRDDVRSAVSGLSYKSRPLEILG